jgi:hypothetical protein
MTNDRWGSAGGSGVMEWTEWTKVDVVDSRLRPVVLDFRRRPAVRNFGRLCRTSQEATPGKEWTEGGGRG